MAKQYNPDQHPVATHHTPPIIDGAAMLERPLAAIARKARSYRHPRTHRHRAQGALLQTSPHSPRSRARRAPTDIPALTAIARKARSYRHPRTHRHRPHRTAGAGWGVPQASCVPRSRLTGAQRRMGAKASGARCERDRDVGRHADETFVGARLARDRGQGPFQQCLPSPSGGWCMVGGGWSIEPSQVPE